MSNEGLVISYIIDAMEVRNVATADIPGSLLQTHYEKVDIPIKMEEAMVNLLYDIKSSYYK